ncbi:uncharacterized protein BO66DRAFT_474994 [Aspergillus aculeatinus CBS 121060]|uniref:Uncharacterized protein n=1 Tax=Aspergillus aculeatinus CBS 121060 TaxID=1448322 RepID=A0ACD1GW87_9EURO|nr:hypothetical protein BO66DRAFT_474994 [Aspergillus aculeatinus CBS 121060]RAH65463.1 hypothetical protein BO66DRAFT_474994 [Aspergillus aculeatinus CBS 121060]
MSALLGDWVCAGVVDGAVDEEEEVAEEEEEEEEEEEDVLDAELALVAPVAADVEPVCDNLLDEVEDGRAVVGSEVDWVCAEGGVVRIALDAVVDEVDKEVVAADTLAVESLKVTVL